jgi:maleate isomerase
MASTVEDTYQVLPSTLDGGVTARAAIGLVVLATDQTIEHEWREMIRIPGVAVYAARQYNDPDITPETLRALADGVTPTAALMQVNGGLDVVAFGCTSGAMVNGEERIFELIRAAHPQARATTPITAARVAIESLGVRRIGLLTPYARAINESMRAYIEARGISVTRMASYENPNDFEVARIDAASIDRGVGALAAHDDVDAVFVSCTSLRVAEQVAALEAKYGKPVTSSNHAMAWHALRLAGIDDAMPRFGRLMTLPMRGTPG